MAIFQRLLARLNTLQSLASGERNADERFNLAVELPSSGDKPLWRMELQMHSEPHGDGEKLRLRAHFQTNLASALKPALEQKEDAQALPGTHRRQTLAERTGRRVQQAAGRVLEVPLIAALAEPLLRHDVNTWVEVQASTASLDSGTRDLIPQGEKLAAMGIVPKQKNGPMLESWAGQSPGGYAQVSVLQMNKSQLPPNLQQALGNQPFQLAAAVVNTVEEKKP